MIGKCLQYNVDEMRTQILVRCGKLQARMVIMKMTRPTTR